MKSAARAMPAARRSLDPALELPALTACLSGDSRETSETLDRSRTKRPVRGGRNRAVMRMGVASARGRQCPYAPFADIDILRHSRPPLEKDVGHALLRMHGLRPDLLESPAETTWLFLWRRHPRRRKPARAETEAGSRTGAEAHPEAASESLDANGAKPIWTF